MTGRDRTRLSSQIFPAKPSRRGLSPCWRLIALMASRQCQRRCSAHLYRLVGSHWNPFAPPSRPPFDLWHSMKQRSDSSLYADQKKRLEKAYEKEGVDIFIASHLLRENPDGSRFSYCVWSQDCDSLLPEAGNIAFNVSHGGPIFLPWERAVSIVHSRMELHPWLYPLRYRMKSFPDQKELELLRSRAPKK